MSTLFVDKLNASPKASSKQTKNLIFYEAILKQKETLELLVKKNPTKYQSRLDTINQMLETYNRECLSC